jgi:hypothetical protein
MKSVFVFAALAALGLAACSPAGSGSGGGGGLSESECRAIVDKSREMAGMPDGVFEEESEQTVQQCLQSSSVSKSDYDCAMAATSPEAFQACRIDVTR